MNKLFRFAVVAALTVAMLAAVPTAQAQQEPIGDCPYVFYSNDGGQTWTQCDNYGRVETRESTTCYYAC